MEIKTKEHLSEELDKVFEQHGKGVITQVECIVRQQQLITYALISGVTWEDMNKIP